MTTTDTTSVNKHEYEAVNTAELSANAIHSDGMAKEYGFKGALVPGSATYSHALTTVMAAFGEQWFTGGSAFLRFPSPIYTGDKVVVEIAGTGAGESTLTSSVAGEVRASGYAAAVSHAKAPKTFPLVEAPPEPVHISEPDILDNPWLGSAELATDESLLEEYRAKILLPGGLAQQLGVVHPGYLASSYTAMMHPNFARKGPSVHVSTLLNSHKPAPVGEPLSLRGRIERLYGRNGHRYWILELAWYDTAEDLVMHAEHTAIYRLRPPKK
ncbi:MaoC dehydratase-like protein [Antricoccus suffuscus]|uniref:MaoC dehydratase-like protein n=1 Tax=Antricoccus suffuscus TaxID=1629062 RepID=A0A2T0ZTP7_9ACTN|nr:MaoC/PaaZ C-terminal domain-containing protein [Antricoccus suffuscus]PRZ39730.1 MaoC dehydratase-like protein [Antricoccus suffuscus]